MSDSFKKIVAEMRTDDVVSRAARFAWADRIDALCAITDDAVAIAHFLGHGTAPKHVRRTVESYRCPAKSAAPGAVDAHDFTIPILHFARLTTQTQELLEAIREYGAHLSWEANHWETAGSSRCPICGKDTPHLHPGSDIAAYRIPALTAAKAAQPATDHEGRPLTYWGGVK